MEAFTMKAFEARLKSMKNQFEWVEKKIKKAIEKGESRIIVKKTPLYDEVIEKLLDDGFDLLIIEDPANSFTEISMLISEEGRCGGLEYVSIEWEFCDSGEEDDDSDDDDDDDFDKACVIEEDNSELNEDGECCYEDCEVEEENTSNEEETVDTSEVIEENNEEVFFDAAGANDKSEQI